MNINLGKYRKVIVAALAYLGVVGTIIEDGTVDSNEWVALASGLAGVFAVYQVRNEKK